MTRKTPQKDPARSLSSTASQAEAGARQSDSEADRSEARITELETRTAFQEDLLNTLNDVIANQDRLLAGLSNKLEQLEEQIRQGGFGGAGGGDGLAEEPPPHY